MGEACFAQWDDLWSRGDSTSWTRKAFQEKRCQPFSMIPLERWNVERSGTFCDKRTMIWLIQPIVRLLILHMARQESRFYAKLERKYSTGPTLVCLLFLAWQVSKDCPN